MKKITMTWVAVMMMFTAVSAFAAKGKPSFTPQVFADGQVWGTKGTTALPEPTEKNEQSYDGLFIIMNGASGQLPVSEAGPRNRNYNGGRWITYTAEWTTEGLDEYSNEVPLISSYAELLMEYMLGHIDIEIGSFEGGPPPYFQCPLLPVKG